MTVTTRRERREQELRRRQRQKRGGQPAGGGGGGRRDLLIGAGILVLAIVVLFGLRQAGMLAVGSAAVASPTPLPTASPVASDDPARGIHDPDENNAHVNAGTPVQYAQLPPTSGSHWPAPAGPVKAGVYTQHIPFEATVHNLEHGGIVIVYNGLSPDEVTRLDNFVKSAMAGTYKKVLDEPYTDLSRAKIVLTAWRWHLDLQSVDTAAMQKFLQVHYDSPEAPEPGTAW